MPSTISKVCVFAFAGVVGYIAASQYTLLGAGSRTVVRAAVDKSLPIPFGQSAGKPRTAKPVYTKEIKYAPLRQSQPWVGEWVDPVTMFSGGLNFGRSGKPKTARVSSGKVATPMKTLSKKPWTGNLGSYYAKLVAKGQPYKAPSMEKAASTSSVKMPGSWIGSASDYLIARTGEAAEKAQNPTPKIKMWMTVGDPLGPWKQAAVEKTLAPQSSAKSVDETLTATEEVKAETSA
mmetsp:Transcript_18527/g.27744  ORF Transcript_18527/g.27744 Transcript_18527/m.27744 type:complete len:234 (+) Transcript_18527:86-787(+)